MENSIVLYEKTYPAASVIRNLKEALGYIDTDDIPEIPMENAGLPSESQHFIKLAIWLSESWHIDVLISQYRDVITVEYTFPEHCSFFSPYFRLGLFI